MITLKTFNPPFSDREEIELPELNSDWGTIAEFALSFNGYKYVNGGPIELGKLWDRVVENPDIATMEELRACLFAFQRACRVCGTEDTPVELAQFRNILSLIIAKATNEPL